MDRREKTVFNRVLQHIPELGVDKTFIDLRAAKAPPIPHWINGATLYEIYLRAFSKQGTFRSAAQRLPELKQLGIDFIWLMPIYPIGRDKRKGTLGSPYAIRDYFEVNPEFGSKADFKDFVQKAHQLGMHVIIDMVPNHVAPDFTSLTNQPGLVVRDAQGRPKRKVADWTDVVDLDYRNQETQAFMAKVMRFWIQEFDVDGYRCDVAGLVPLDFWQWVIPKLRQLKSDLFMLAEWESPLLHQAGFNSSYDWTTRRLLKGCMEGEIPVSLLADWISTKNLLYPRNSIPLRFLENHDLPRSVRTFTGEQLFAALTLMFSLNGLPLLYNGQEIGAKAQPSLFEKEEILWEERDFRIYETIKELVRLRKTEQALWSSNYVFYKEALKQGVLAFNKIERLRVLINMTSQEQVLRKEWTVGIQTVLFNSCPNPEKNGIPQTLKPYQALITQF